ncbi:hypothetical protein LSG31_01525 [Fodinisporobacter ferrooxydans]|uniref:Plasmid replication protein RepL domain-containing protein n=1 Tax=Fodinisporobacter ferrooxydans TaxID=2901836 RepID=A0ABY4CL29_9BACL|nr:hypothetical protein LSG31_01525 [Alicyclobacillaceae bacterium MYW30-H2]
MGVVLDERSGQWFDDETGEIINVLAARNGSLENNTDKPVLAVVEVPANGKVKATKKGNKLQKIKNEPSFTMVFSYPDILEYLLTGQLTVNERAFLFTLLFFTEYGKTQIMVPDANGKPERLMMSRAGQIMGWKHSQTTKTVVESLEKKRLLKVEQIGKTKYIELNPRIFFKGSTSLRNKQIKFYESESI